MKLFDELCAFILQRKGEVEKKYLDDLPAVHDSADYHLFKRKVKEKIFGSEEEKKKVEEEFITNMKQEMKGSPCDPFDVVLPIIQ